MLFIVTKEGVFRHEIIGIFDETESAWLAAERMINEETDDYHRAFISTAKINEFLVDDVKVIGEVVKADYVFTAELEKKGYPKRIKGE